MAGRRRVAAAGAARITDLQRLVATEVPKPVELVARSATFGSALRSLRIMERASLLDFAKRLGIPYRHLQDVEKDRRTVSIRRAGEWAQILGYPQQALVRLAIQHLLDEAGIPLRCKLEQP